MGKSRKVRVETKAYQKSVDNFYKLLSTLGYKEASTTHGKHCVEDFLGYLEQRGMVEMGGVSAEELEKYRLFLNERPNRTKGGKINPKTVHHHIRYLGHFFDMQLRQGHISVNPFDSFEYHCPQGNDRERVVLSQEEIKQLYGVAGNHYERAVLALAYGCGLRAGEMERLNLEDVNYKTGMLLVKTGKGGKRRVVPMARAVSGELENYHYEERVYEDSYESRAFLLNQKQRRFREHNGNYLLKALSRRTGNEEIIKKSITLHVLRHSIATHFIEQGMSLEKVRDFLGHSHIETTEIYTHIASGLLKRLLT